MKVIPRSCKENDNHKKTILYRDILEERKLYRMKKKINI